MKRATIAALSACLVLACSGGEKERAKLAELQQQADERIAQVEKDAKDKIAAAQQMIEELQGELADAGAQAKAAAEEEIASAKGEADKFAAQAAQALGKARAAYKETEKKQLTALSKEAEELHAKAAKTATAKNKPSIDLALKDVATKKEAARKEIDTFDAATLDTIKSVKLKVDKAMADLKHALQALRAKVS